MKKLFLLFALVLTAGMNAWAADYVATDYLNNNSHTYIEKMPTLTDPSMCIHIFQRDPENGKVCVTWGGYEDQNKNILPTIYIDGELFAQPGWELCWLNNNPDNDVDTWWDAKDSDCHIYTKEINGVTWTLRFYNPRKMHDCYYVYMYFCPSEIEGGSKHTITVKGRLTEYVAKNTPSTTNYLDVERDFVFDMPKLITSDPIVVKENTNEYALSFYGNLAEGAEKSTYFGVYVNDGTVNGFVPYDQLDGKQELAYATTFSNIKYTIPEKFEGKDLRGQMHRDFTELLGGKVSVCHYYGRFNAAANAIHYEVTEPTYTTFGYLQECWKDPATGIIYSDIFFENELNPAQVLTYAKFITNPVTANTGFTIKDATYGDVQFNWAAETTYSEWDSGTRSVEFTVYGTDVDNARLKWTKTYSDARYGKFNISVYVNGEQVYSIQNYGGADLFAVPLQGLKTGDIVRFEVTETALQWAGSPMIAACLEYTSSNGGNKKAIHYDAVQPTYETVGNIEYWEDKETGKFYSDATCTQELNPVQVLTYAKFISNPVTANNGFTLKEDATYEDVQFNWAAETTYPYDARGTRSVEFTVFGTEVANARLKWTKTMPLWQYGQFTITVYVNDEQKYSVNQDGYQSLSGIFIVPLEELKVDDVVKFEIKKPWFSEWDGSVMIAACLEYTSSNGGAREVIHHDAVQPTYTTVGYSQEFWEDKKIGKYYSDVTCTQELNPAQVITYKKLISDPVTANNGFTLKDATYEGVQFNWAAETTYNTSDTDTRSVEFTVFGTDVANARVKWTKNYNAAGYGSFIITVYVNDTQVYSVNQNNGEFLGGLFAVPLPDLKSGDNVKFEVNKPTEAVWPDSNPTITACLEYTSSSGGAGVILTADDKLKNKGDDDPELTWQITGGSLAEGDELTGIKIWREEGEEIGSYTIHVSQEEGSNPKYYIAFVEGTFRISDIIHHDVTEPTYETVGYLQECWEAFNFYKFYSDATYTQELSPAQVVTYKKLISDPVTANNGFTLKEDATYGGVQFNWAAETTYGVWDKGTRSVEFTVYGTDVDNARVKWNKDSGAYQYGIFTITVYVNGTQVYSINQDDNKSLGGLFAVPLQGLKTGDVVKFEVQKPKVSSWAGNVTIAACLEYTSSNGGYKVIHYDAAEPTYTTVGYSQECWEDKETGKYYSDAACTKELSPAQVITYKKLISDPVTANNGFTLKDATYEGVQFNWAAETTYPVDATGTRSVEFTVFGTDVANARVKWTKDYNDADYGSFIITVYVNGTQVYSINQGNNALGGLSAIPLPDLKSGDKVKFEVNKTNVPTSEVAPTITVCLEYTSSNGGFNSAITITADDKYKYIEQSDPELTWKITNGALMEGDELTDIKIWREAGENVGLYLIHVSQEEGTNPKYNITFVDGVFRIIDAIHHDAAEPTYTTVGYSQECWEDRTTGKYYSDAVCTKELNPVQVLTYAKFISNPVTANNGFTLKDATYEDVQFNWAAETTYPVGTTDTRSVEFTVFGTDVANARVKWTKDYNDADYGSFIITVYVNGTQVYSINQGNNALGGLSAIPLPDLKSGDKVKFEVNKPNVPISYGEPTITACLEYTSSNGGAREVIHHEAVEPTYETTGNMEYWEEKETGKYYFDAACTKELSPAQVVLTYAKFITCPVTANIAFTLKDATYDGVPFDFAVETTYNNNVTGTRSVEFTVFGTDVANARLKWTKNNPDCIYGQFTITVYVNGTQVYSINQDNGEYLGGLFAVPLQGLKTDDVVKFEIKKPWNSHWGSVMIAACLEYTSSNGGAREVIHHEAVEPTYETTGNIEYWEDEAVKKLFSDAECINEVEPEQVIAYQKFISNPVSANTGFTIKDATYKGVPFNWAAETTYPVDATGTRYVEFTVYGTDVANARVKWTKDYNDADYGSFIITVYVNGTQVYSINQGDNALGGLSAIPLPDLKSGDKVKFEVNKPKKANWNGSPTITACLEYTSSNGGEREVIHHDAVQPTYETVGNIEYWENKITGQFYSDVTCTQELSPAQVFTYKKLISDPVTANNGFTLVEDAAYGGVQFNWAAETTYERTDTGIRYVEFTVFGKDVDNARVKWTKTAPNWQYGKFTITVYVNGTQVYSINQDDNKSLSGLFAVPLQGLKTGDVVKFEVQKPKASYWAGNVTIAACLEYTSSNGGEGMLITANQDPDHTENYYSTFWSSTDAYQVPEGVTAYTGKVEDSTSEPNTSVLKLTAIEDGIIPASQGVILRMTTEDNSATKRQIALAKTTATGTWSGTNALTGTDVATTLGANQYALSLGQNGVGFYNWDGRALGAHKAYLTLSGSQPAPLRSFGFRFDDGTTTGISATIFDQPLDDAIYNLQGQRVDESYKGLIIKNGQKVYNY